VNNAQCVIAMLMLCTCRFSFTSLRTDTTPAVPAVTSSFAVDLDSFNSATTDGTTAIRTVIAASPTAVSITTPATFDTNAWLSFDKPSSDTAVATSFANFDTDASSGITDATAASTSVIGATAGLQSKESDDDSSTEFNNDKSDDNTSEKQEPTTPAAAAVDSTNDVTASTADRTVSNDDNAALASEHEVAAVADTDKVHNNTVATNSDTAAATTPTVTAASDATIADDDSITVASDTAATESAVTAIDAPESVIQQSSYDSTDTVVEHVASDDKTSGSPDTSRVAQHTASTASSDLTATTITTAIEAPVARISVLAKLSPAVTLAEVLANDTLSPVLSNNPRYVCISHIRHHTGEFSSTIQTSSSTSGSTTVSALEVFDLLKGQCNRYPITAAAAIMRPAVSDSEPRVIALYVKQDSATNSSGRFNVFNMDSGARLRDQPMAAPLLLWRWLNSSVLVLVTHASVFHWDTSGHSRPVKGFDRQYTLPHAIATAASNSDTAVTTAAARSRSASVSANSVCLKGYSCSNNCTVATADWAMLLAIPAQHTIISGSSIHDSSLTVDLHDFKRSATYKLRVLGACFSSVNSSSNSSTDSTNSEAVDDVNATPSVLTTVTTDVHDASKYVLKVLDLSKPPTAGSIDADNNMCQGWCVLAEHQLNTSSSGSSGSYILLPLTTATAAAVVIVSRSGHVSVVSITTGQDNSTVQCIERLSVQACNGMTVIDANFSSDSKYVVLATAATETQTCRVLKVALHDVL
jgi:hypothetical protein